MPIEALEKKPTATNKPKVTAYLSPDIETALEIEAKKEKRSKSQMVELLLAEALKTRGHSIEN